jgi:homoserine acetyltransferase
MNRRGFFGVAAGAAVVGPGMAKAAATKMAQTAAMGQIMGGGINLGPQDALGVFTGETENPIERAARKLAILRGLTKDQMREVRKMVGPVRSEMDLDPDLASYRSISLSAKMQMQMDRNVERYLSERTSWWQQLFDGGGEIPDSIHYEL